MEKRRGYTLTELLTTIAIIAILVTVSVVGFVTYINKSQNGKADTEFAQINKVFENSYITGGLFHVGTDGKYNVYLEKHDGVAYITLLPLNDTEYDPKMLEIVQITDYSEDLNNLSGTLTCTLAKGFYDEFELNNSRYYRTLCDVKYTTEEGIERNFTLNEKSKDELKVILEAKMIENHISSFLKSQDEIYIGKYSNSTHSNTFKVNLKVSKQAISFVTERFIEPTYIIITSKSSDLNRYTGNIFIYFTYNGPDYDYINTPDSYRYTVSKLVYTDENNEYSSDIHLSIQ